MDKQLKPCPFCGEQVESMMTSFGVAGVIICKKCKTKFVIPWDEAESEYELFNAWNRRAGNEK